MSIAHSDQNTPLGGVSLDLVPPSVVKSEGAPQGSTEEHPLKLRAEPRASGNRHESERPRADLVQGTPYRFPRLGPNMAARLHTYLVRQGLRDLNDAHARAPLTARPTAEAVYAHLRHYVAAEDRQGRPRRLYVDHSRFDGLSRHELSRQDVDRQVRAAARAVAEQWDEDYRARAAERGRAGGQRAAMLHRTRPARRVADLDDLDSLPRAGMSKREIAAWLGVSTATVARLRAQARKCAQARRDPATHRVLGLFSTSTDTPPAEPCHKDIMRGSAMLRDNFPGGADGTDEAVPK